VTVFAYNRYQHSLNRPIRHLSKEAGECEYLKHTNRGKRHKVSNRVTNELDLKTFPKISNIAKEHPIGNGAKLIVGFHGQLILKHYPVVIVF